MSPGDPGPSRIQQDALAAGMGAADFSSLTPERAAEIAAKVEALPDDRVRLVIGQLEQWTQAEAAYRLNLANARLLLRSVLAIAAVT